MKTLAKVFSSSINVIMLSLKLTNFKKISVKDYNDIIRKETIRELLRFSSIGNFTIHGYYYRDFLDEDGKTVTARLMRIKCTDVTHVVILEQMLPYFRYQAEDLVTMIVDDTPPKQYPKKLYDKITSSIDAIKHKFRKYDGTDYESLCTFIAQQNNITIDFVSYPFGISPDSNETISFPDGPFSVFNGPLSNYENNGESPQKPHGSEWEIDFMAAIIRAVKRKKEMISMLSSIESPNQVIIHV